MNLSIVAHTRHHIQLHVGNRPALLATLSLVAFSVATIVGCNNGPPMHEVKGMVMFKGASPPSSIGLVRFQPTEDSKAIIRKGATGTIRADGSFEMFTRKPGDGVHQGEYVVTFMIFKSMTDQKSLVENKYTTPHLSPITILVENDIDDVKFEVEPAAPAS